MKPPRKKRQSYGQGAISGKSGTAEAKTAAGPTWATKVSELREYLGMRTQQELARKIGRRQSTISRWENKDGTKNQKPEPGDCIYLGLLARGNAPLRNYFWSLSGQDVWKLISDVSKDSVPPAAGSTRPRHSIPVLRNICRCTAPDQAIGEDLAGWLDLPADVVPHPKATSLVIVSDNSMLPLVAPGDLVLLDASTPAIPMDLVAVRHPELGGRLRQLLDCGVCRATLPSADVLANLPEYLVLSENGWQVKATVIGFFKRKEPILL